MLVVGLVMFSWMASSTISMLLSKILIVPNVMNIRVLNAQKKIVINAITMQLLLRVKRILALWGKETTPRRSAVTATISHALVSEAAIE